MSERSNMTTCAEGRPKYGFSLVELLVAMAIGLLVALVVTKAYVDATATQRAQADSARLQESARFGFLALADALRKSGYQNQLAIGDRFCPMGSSSPPIPRLAGVNDATSVDPTTPSFTGGSEVAVLDSDVIRVRYYGDGLTLSPFTADGSVRDCLGNPVASNALTEDTFFVAADSTNGNEPALFCYTSNSPASGNVALVPGVERMQLLYGDDSDSDGLITDRFAPIGSISAPNNVRSVIVSLVVRSPNAVAAQQSTRVFNHFGDGGAANQGYAPSNVAPTGDSGSVFTAPADGRLRAQTSTTIALRNLCP
ncbi:PilW family protein [Propionivibrio soli]|uniref:PilW family protein n=1 Tax=Propionivibrio soli TaxID=2976531 RepID=UPI003B845221